MSRGTTTMKMISSTSTTSTSGVMLISDWRLELESPVLNCMMSFSPGPSGLSDQSHPAEAGLLGCNRLIIDPQLARLVDGDQDPASLVTLTARLRRVRQVHVRSLPHLRRHHHEDDQQHEHDVDERRDVNGSLHLGWFTEPH